MKKNVGSLDKNLRLLAGVIILVLGYLNDSWWGLVGIVPILTSLSGFCPFYVPLKMTTIKSKK